MSGYYIMDTNVVANSKVNTTATVVFWVVGKWKVQISDDLL
jgi:hypothetical protein